MSSQELGFIHCFVPAAKPDNRFTLLLLHGTGGDENDLLPLGNALATGAAFLSPRGKIVENGMPRFFRRLAEGVFDLDDLVFRTHELADFVGSAATAYGFAAQRVIAVGFSNGANIAASLMLLRPEVLAAAVLFHPMVPLTPAKKPDLAGVSVFIGAGKMDPLIPATESERLAALLRTTGAEVKLHWQNGGHSIGREEFLAAQQWLAELMRPDTTLAGSP